MTGYIDRALHFRNLAEEVRVKASLLKTADAREVFGKLASDYDSLAQSLEQAAKLENSD